jgi:acetylornithine deacetylase/succinyl-diaminopimelate desuccinylase-like protein
MTDPRHLDDFLSFLRYPSISTDPSRRDDSTACASWLVAKLAGLGLDARMHFTPGLPIVTARNTHRADRPTVLIYGHYDVQPVDPLDLWTHPPFEPHIENGVVYARGATDNKGQILAHILGVQETLAGGAGTLPVNLIFLIEGEEEVGSTHLASFLHLHARELACDVVVISDTGMVGPGIPTLTYALRGIAALNATVTGPALDLHSGIFGGAVVNPVTALARLIATLHTDDYRVAVEGFYNEVMPLEPWEREAWSDLPWNDDHFLTLTGAPALDGEAGYSSLERIWARPTIEVNGFGGGYQGAGTKTVLPSTAHAKFTCRLVPGQNPEVIRTRLESHLRKHTPKGVTLQLEPGHGGYPYFLDPRGRFGLAAQRALSAAFDGKKPALIREGGSIPIVSDFKQILHADTLLLGLALPDCRAHAPDENFPLANLEAGIRLNQAVLQELAC